LSRKIHNIHVRITEEEYNFLKRMNISKSMLVREAIHNKMKELPENLRKRKQELLKEINEIDEKLKLLEKKEKERNQIYHDIALRYLEREKNNPYLSEEQQREWLRTMAEKKELSLEKLEKYIKEMQEQGMSKERYKRGGNCSLKIQ